MSSSAGGTAATQIHVFGGIPESWSQQTLGEICSQVKKIHPQDLGRSQFKYVDISSIDSATNRVVAPQELLTTQAPSRARQLIRNGDIIFSTVRPYLLNIASIDATLDGEIASTGFCVLRPNPRAIIPELMHFFAISDHLLEQVLPLQRGVSYPAIRDKEVLGALIVVPPLEEQRVIVDVLEGQFSFLDAVLESVRRSRVEAVRLRRALLRDAFSGVLTHPDLPPGETPEGWSTSCLGELVKFAPKPSASLVASGVEVSYVPMAKVSEVSGEIQCDETISVTQGKKRSLTYFEDGDVIFAKITPCMENGKSAVAKGLLNGAAFGSSEFHVMRLSPQLLPSYLWFVLVHDDFRYLAERSMTGAVGQRRVPRSFIEDYALSVPPLEEQHEIVELLERELGLLDLAMKAADRIEIQAKSLRRSLLHSAFNGELTREWRENHG